MVRLCVDVQTARRPPAVSCGRRSVVARAGQGCGPGQTGAEPTRRMRFSILDQWAGLQMFAPKQIRPAIDRVMKLKDVHTAYVLLGG